MMHIVVFSGDGVKLVKPEMASAAQVHYLSLIQRCGAIVTSAAGWKIWIFVEHNGRKLQFLVCENILQS